MWDLSSVSGAFQWMAFNDPDLERKVLRFARFNCRKLFRIDPEKVRHINYSADSDFLLIYLTDGTEELYGFYNYASPKFHPLTEDYLTVFDLVTFLSAPGLAGLIGKIEASYDAYFSANGDAIFFLLNNDVVVDNFLPTQQWQLFTREEIHYSKVIDFLTELYKPFLKESQEEDMELWYSPLGFSSSYHLMEVHFYLHGMNNRIYLLFDFNWSDPFNFRSAIIDGNAIAIYGVWNKQDTDQKDFVLETTEQIRDYLHFFCWAVEGKEGHFILPTKDEMPWMQKPDTNVGVEVFREKIKKEKITPGDNKASVTDISVIYGNSIFQGTFEIDLLTGVPEMIDDLPLAADLPFKSASFKNLRTPDDEAKGTSRDQTTQKQQDEELDSWEGKERILRKLTEKSAPLTQAKAKKLLETHTTLEDYSIKEGMDFHGAFSQGKPVVIKNCLFQEEVTLLNLENTSRIEFTNCVFIKKVHAVSARLQCDLVFEDCVFKGNMDHYPSVNFHNFRSSSDLVFRKCSFFGNAVLTNMEVSGDLIIAGCTLSTIREKIHRLQFTEPTDVIQKQDKVPRTSAYLQLSQSSVHGSLKIIGLPQSDKSLLGCFIGGGVAASGIEVHGETRFYHSFVNDFVDFSFSQFKGPVRLTLWQDRHRSYVQVKILGALTFQNSRIEGELSLDYLETLDVVDLYGIDVDLNVSVLGVKCQDLDLKFGEVRGGVYAYRHDYSIPGRSSLQIEGDLDFTGASIKVIRLEAIDVTGKIRARTGEFNNVEISLGWGPDDTKSKLRPRNSEVGNIELRSVSIKNDLDLSGINSKGGISIYNSEIGGDLNFFNDRNLGQLIKGSNADELKQRLAINTEFINFEEEKLNFIKWLESNPLRSNIGQEVPIFEKANITIHSSRISGSLFLNNLTVDGDIQLDNSTIALDLDASGIFIKPGTRNKPDVTGGFEIKCKNLSMRNLQVGQDAKMFGVRISSSETEEKIIGGDFTAPRAIIKGGLILVADKDGKYRGISSEDIMYRALIEGDFDVSISQINELSFTKENFSPRDDQEEGAGQIDLERSFLDKLRVFEPTPQNINLTGTRVNHWDFGNREGNCNARASDYKNVLKNMQFFDKQIYVDVEKALRNRSEDREANKIYREMRNREKKGLRLERLITDYGTNFWRTLIIWLSLVFVLAGLLFGFGVLKYPNPFGKALNFGENLLYAFQSCIPLFELDVLRDVQVRNTGWKFVIILFTILSYVVLSIALYGFSTRVSRIKQ